MSNRSKAANSAAAGTQWRRPGVAASALAVLLIIWTGAPGDVRADSIVLKSGEVIEGSIIDATRNTVIVRRSIGGMRQMRIQDIEEVRIDLARGQEISGQFLSWADGVYQVRARGEVIRISEGNVLSREPGQETAGQPPRTLPPRRAGERTVRMAAGPAAPAAEEAAAQNAEDQNRGPAAADVESQAAADAASQAAAAAESQAAADARSLAAGDAASQAADAASEAAADAESQAAAAATSQAADAASQAAGDAAGQAVADAGSQAAGDDDSLAVKASVAPPEPGAQSMVFKIELSRPAEQTVVLIYGTVDGTAKAGEDYEPRQGMVTLTPGTKSAEVRVPLLDGQPEEGDKRFELFLMADSKVAEVVDKRVIATIKGAD